MNEVKIFIDASGRHVHLCEADLFTLFGEGFELERKRSLGGDFLSTSSVQVVGPNGKSCKCSILGPCRKVTQIEVSYTEARAIGAVPPISDSGKVEGTAPVTLIGPAGTVELKEGMFVARRHVHMTYDDAQAIGCKDGDSICVRVEGPRALVFEQVTARVFPQGVGPKSSTMHVDYDEWNAAAPFTDPYGYAFVK